MEEALPEVQSALVLIQPQFQTCEESFSKPAHR
jgi:hypothetical protein